MSPRDDQNSQPGTKEWAFETGGKVWSSPAVADGTVYVGNYDSGIKGFSGIKDLFTGRDHNHNLYAVDAATGIDQWSFETGGRIRSSPTVVGGTVYVGSGDGNLYAVDADFGTEQWSFKTGGRSSLRRQ